MRKPVDLTRTASLQKFANLLNPAYRLARKFLGMQLMELEEKELNLFIGD